MQHGMPKRASGLMKYNNLKNYGNSSICSFVGLDNDKENGLKEDA